MKRKSDGFLKLVLIAGVLLSLFALMLHHHDSGSHTVDCALCRLVPYFAFLVGGLLGVLLSDSSKSNKYFASFRKLTSQFFVSRLFNKAPPLLF